MLQGQGKGTCGGKQNAAPAGPAHRQFYHSKIYLFAINVHADPLSKNKLHFRRVAELHSNPNDEVNPVLSCCSSAELGAVMNRGIPGRFSLDLQNTRQPVKTQADTGDCLLVRRKTAAGLDA